MSVYLTMIQNNDPAHRVFFPFSTFSLCLCCTFHFFPFPRGCLRLQPIVTFTGRDTILNERMCVFRYVIISCDGREREDGLFHQDYGTTASLTIRSNYAQNFISILAFNGERRHQPYPKCAYLECIQKTLAVFTVTHCEQITHFFLLNKIIGVCARMCCFCWFQSRFCGRNKNCSQNQLLPERQQTIEWLIDFSLM